MSLLCVSSATVHAESVVFVTPLGNFEVELFSDQAPNTVANFLNYVDDEDYKDSFVHRSVPGFVIQGGGFVFRDGTVDLVPTDPPVQNEPGISNERGTVAMAKVPGDPDSATSQWFINLVDNPTLDTDNGGFTVFGKVVGDGMDVVDLIASQQVWNGGSTFPDLPLIDFPGGDATVEAEHIVFANVLRHSDFVINAGLNDAWVSDSAPFQGMFITVFEDLGLVFLAWFTFDSVPPDGAASATFGAVDQRWVTALGTIDGNRVVLSAELTTGGAFNAEQPTPVQTPGYGTITLLFVDCETVLVSYDFPTVGLSGSFTAGRVLDSNVPLCETLSASDD